MGHGVIISCQICGYSREFQLGVGMMSGSMKNVIDFFPKILPRSKKSEVQNILQKHTVKQTDFSHELFQCRECNRFYDKFWVKIIYDNDQVYETDYRCNKCEGHLILISQDELPQTPCPKCGREGLSASENLLWD